MTRIPEAIAELEARRDQIDAAIAVLRNLDAPVQVATVNRAPKPATRKPVATKPAAGSPPTADEIARAKKLWEGGASAKQVADAVGRTISWVYNQSSNNKWRRGKTLSARVECPHCALKTLRDPCENCGKTVGERP